MVQVGEQTDPAEKAKHATSFGAAADLYERARPTYPEAAVDWLLPPRARRVLDLGAGTGKLTAALVARGLDVAAVDPSPRMLERLRRNVPDVVAEVGTAEAIPLPDASVDAVLVAQAWHWVDPARAVPEVARVLAPGGTLGLIWNLRDLQVAWVSRLHTLITGDQPTPHYHEPPEVGAPFTPFERHEVAWTKRMDETQLVDLVDSRSYTLTSSAAERDRLLRETRDAFRSLPKAADDARRIDMPYVTRCFRAHREA